MSGELNIIAIAIWLYVPCLLIVFGFGSEAFENAREGIYSKFEIERLKNGDRPIMTIVGTLMEERKVRLKKELDNLKLKERAFYFCCIVFIVEPFLFISG